jgi:hypothetical protein
VEGRVEVVRVVEVGRILDGANSRYTTSPVGGHSMHLGTQNVVLG